MAVGQNSAANKSQHRQEKNSWECRESNLGLLVGKLVCYLCAMQHPQIAPLVLLSDLSKFESHLVSLNHLYLGSGACRAVLSSVLLFDWNVLDASTSSGLENLAIINNILFDDCCSDRTRLGLEGLTSALVQLSIVFANAAEQIDMLGIKTEMPSHFRQENILTTFNVLMKYTREEEAWVQDQFRLLEEAFCSVKLDGKFLDHFVSLAQGFPVPGDSVLCMMGYFRERIWRMFNIHPEFKNLSRQDQANYVNKNGASGAMLLIVRAELATYGLEQLKVIICRVSKPLT